MPRRPKIPSSKDLQEIESMAGLGLTQQQISRIKGISIDTLRKYASDTYQAGKAKAIGMVAKTAYDMATSGKNTAMTIFYLKTQARWTEHPSMPEMIQKVLSIEAEEHLYDFENP